MKWFSVPRPWSFIRIHVVGRIFKAVETVHLGSHGKMQADRECEADRQGNVQHDAEVLKRVQREKVLWAEKGVEVKDIYPLIDLEACSAVHTLG